LKPRRVSVLLNAGSGSATDCDKLRANLESAFSSVDVAADVAVFTGDGLRAGAERALQKAKAGELDAIVVGGGDGTISTVANVFAGTSVPLGIIPAGTLNHFAKDLKIPLEVEEAVAVIGAGHSRSVDVAEVNGRIFINNSSIGLYPYLVLDRVRRQRRSGLPKWLAMILAGFRALLYLPVQRLSIYAPDGTETHRSPCVFIGNNEYRMDGASLGTRDRLDEGRLHLYVAKQESRLALLGLACRSILGLLSQQQDLRALMLPAVEIDSHHRRLLVAFDGEIEVMRAPLHYRIKPRALRVFAPAPATA
jgi:diacylglycerol kinase family enzyme